ncbi:MAG: glycosyltransferase [Clostridiales bacterium]|nr:glycosyltransferase [Clostridiales bacterium]
MFFDHLALVSGIMLKVFSLYYLVMCLFFRKKTAPRIHYSPKYKFACLIAARNEEAVIGNLIKSLREQNYPPELIEIYVIPNNCTDNTEQAALAAGAEIICPKGVVRSKGDALHFAVRKLLPREDIDCFMIFDADNIADADYMKAMNDAFMSGVQVAKSRIESKNPYDSWVSGCYGLYYNIFNNFFNESRSRLGLSPKLIGTGLGIKREVLFKMGGWNTVTIAEDTEFNANCIIDGYRIGWVPDAITYDETPDSFRISFKQRRRWIGGIMAVAKESLSDIFYEGLSSHRVIQLFDMAMILIMPYMQTISVLPAILILAAAAYGGFFGTAVLFMAGGLVLSYLGITAFGLLLAVLSPYEARSMSKAILMFPIFTFSWMPLCFIALFTGGGSWEQIRHKRTITLKDLNYGGRTSA